jgi:transposase
MIVELLQSGQSSREVSEEYGLNKGMILRWRREYTNDRPSFTGKGVAGLTTQEKEIKTLKKALKTAKIEVEILKKAMGIVSKSEWVNIN